MSDLVGLVRLEGRKLTVTLESRVAESGVTACIAVPKTAREELAAGGSG